MANSWLRLWHEMPTDPKWRTIARVSKRSISEVMSVYIFVLVDASNATERGRTQPNSEDIGSALDMDAADVQSILDAMQGRVLSGDQVSGWSARQPLREDSSAERSKAWREAKRLEEESERNRTQPNATEPKIKTREDKDKEGKDIPGSGEPVNPPLKKKSGKITLKTYIENRKAAGLRAFDEGCAIYQYAESVNLPVEFLSIAWQMYRDKYYDTKKKYDDWQRAFLNALKDGWLKAWYLDNGVFKLTTAGQQAQIARKSHVQH